MNNGQYTIPQGFHEQPQPAEAFFESPAAPRSPESAETVLFERIKDIERGVEVLRSQADETTIPRYRLARIFQSVTERFISNRQAESLEKRLVDIESDIGGSLLPALPGIISQRFWYYGGGWFYEAVDDKGPMYAMYQFSEQGLEKLVNGQPVPLAENEDMHIIATIGLYDEAVRSKLYN